MTSAILTLVFMPYWGPLADRYGNRRVLVATGLVIPFLALGWALFSSLWALVAIQVFSGFVWAGFNLCMSNYIYDAVRPVNLPKIYAYFNTLNTFSVFVGTLVGGSVGGSPDPLGMYGFLASGPCASCSFSLSWFVWVYSLSCREGSGKFVPRRLSSHPVLLYRQTQDLSHGQVSKGAVRIKKVSRLFKQE